MLSCGGIEMNEYRFTLDGALVAYAESKEEAYEELKTIIAELMGEGWEDVFICKDLGITKEALEESE